MKGVHFIILLFFFFFKSYSQQLPAIYFEDINNFWNSYEQYLQCNSDSCVQDVVKKVYLPNSSKCYKELLNEKYHQIYKKYLNLQKNFAKLVEEKKSLLKSIKIP